MPFALAIGAITFGVPQQAEGLAQAQHVTTQAAYMSSKEIELWHYVEIAKSAIAPYYDTPRERSAQRRRTPAPCARGAAAPRLRPGRLFLRLYDAHGTLLMHPRQPDLVGRDLWLMRDPNGALTIQELIRQVSRGGGYVWRRPSTGLVAPKLGYVVPLER